jgi:hypothetical protein
MIIILADEAGEKFFAAAEGEPGVERGLTVGEPDRDRSLPRKKDPAEQSCSSRATCSVGDRLSCGGKRPVSVS